MEKKELFYCYELIDPRNGKVFYVGKGKGDRINHHERNVLREYQYYNESNPHLYNKIKKILNLGMKIGKRIIQYFENEQDAFIVEKERIKEYGIDTLCNIVNGGNGGDTFTKNPNKEEIRKKQSLANKGRKHSLETIEKIRQAKMGEKNPNWKGKSCSEETRKKMRESHEGEKNCFYGKHHNEETKKKLSDSHSGEKNYLYGKHPSLEHKKNMTESIRKRKSNLNMDLVREIREKYISKKYTMKMLAEEYSVSKHCIAKIIYFKTWREE